MASKKQQSRVAKAKRHGLGRHAFEYVELDEEGNDTMVWTLTNAWPTKISSTDLKSEGNEVAIESIEIVHEGLTIANG